MHKSRSWLPSIYIDLLVYCMAKYRVDKACNTYIFNEFCNNKIQVVFQIEHPEVLIPTHKVAISKASLHRAGK